MPPALMLDSVVSRKPLPAPVDTVHAIEAWVCCLETPHIAAQDRGDFASPTRLGLLPSQVFTSDA